jgi:hypothetical protein
MSDVYVCRLCGQRRPENYEPPKPDVGSRFRTVRRGECPFCLQIVSDRRIESISYTDSPFWQAVLDGEDA